MLYEAVRLASRDVRVLIRVATSAALAFKVRCVCSSALLNIAQRLEIHSIARQSLFAVTTSVCNENLQV